MSLQDYAFQLTQMRVEGASGYKSHIQKCDVQEDKKEQLKVIHERTSSRNNIGIPHDRLSKS